MEEKEIVSIVSRFKAIIKENTNQIKASQEYFYTVRKTSPTLYEAFSEWMDKWMNKNPDLRLETSYIQFYKKGLFYNDSNFQGRAFEDFYATSVRVLNKPLEFKIIFKNDMEGYAGTFLY